MILIAFAAMLPLHSASVAGGQELRPDLFYSEEELGKVSFSDDLTESEREYYDSVEISLITACPSEPVYMYFGHSALSVSVPGKDAIIFDWGTFAFSPDFYKQFAFGLLYYSLTASYRDSRIVQFEWEDRTTTEIPLELTPEAKRGILLFLDENIKPENTTYQYHYYKDNCATRIRDIYAYSKPGFREWAESIETGKSYRDYAMPCFAPSLFFAYFLNYLQGPEIDEPLNLYQACFLPSVLEDAVAEYESAEPSVLYETRTREPVPESYSLEIRAFAIGCITAALIALTYTSKRWIRRIGDIASALIYIFGTIMSLILVFMMFFTNHDVTYFNINPLIISPLAAVPAVLHIASAFSKKEGLRRMSISRFTTVLLIIALLALIFQILTPFRQSNASFYITAFMAYGADSALFIASAIRRRKVRKP